MMKKCSLLQYCLVHAFMTSLCFAFDLTILHTNDVHSRFEELDVNGAECSEKASKGNSCYGGVARRYTAVQELRKKHKNVILVDAGDQYQGTLWFYVYKGAAVANFMNMIKYDVMALGNHEFDNGANGLKPLLDNVTFPIISSNMDASMYPEIQSKVQKHVIFNIGGEMVGIIGYTTTETPSISSPDNIKFDDEIQSIKAEVSILQNKGVKYILAVGHSGFAKDLEIAKEVDGIDVVVGGHTNTFLYTGNPPSVEVPVDPYPTAITQPSGKKVLVVQDFAFGKYLGFLQVNFKDDGTVNSWSGNPILLDSSFPEDPQVKAEIVEWEKAIDEARKSVIGKSHVFLDGRRESCRLKECNLGNLFTDAMVHQNLKHPDSTRWANVSLALTNAGGIRNSINAGTVTIENVVSAFPFRNTIDIMEMYGRNIKEIFEHAVEWYSPIEKPGAYLQVSGFLVKYDLNKPINSRVVSLEARCSACSVPQYEPIENDKIYSILLPSFLSRGGDGYTVFPNKNVAHHVIGDLDSDILIEHIKQQSPITAGLERRTMFVDSSKCGSSHLKAMSAIHILFLAFCITKYNESLS